MNAHALLTLRLYPGAGSRTVHRIRVIAREAGHSLHSLFGRPAEELAASVPALSENLAAILANCTERLQAEAAEIIETANAHDLVVLHYGDRGYPVSVAEGLGEHAPPVLFALGDPALAQRCGRLGPEAPAAGLECRPG